MAKKTHTKAKRQSTSKLSIGLKNLGISIKNDFVDLFTKSWLKLIGFIFMFIVPIAILIGGYIKQKPQSWSMPIFVILPLIVLILVYWGKLRRYLKGVVTKMEIENSFEKGKHAGMLILCSFLEAIGTIAPFLLCYYVAIGLNEIAVKIEDVFMFLLLCESVGSLFMIANTIKNVSNTDEEIE